MQSSKFDPYDHLQISLNPDGSLTRYIKLPQSPATGDVESAVGHVVLSKDVNLNSDKKTWMRLYRPAKHHPGARLPIILYFHPGGWIQMSVADTLIHENCNRISSEVSAVLVAVEYRLVPEHRLPAQYEDAIEAVAWVGNQARAPDGDPWIRNFGDIDRCYLYGVSCGSNIAFNAALRLQDLKQGQPMKIAGTILNQPLFGGKKRTKSELKMATDPFFPLPVQDLFWELALPPGTDRDHRYCNPFVDAPMKARVKNLGRCLVIGFGGDPLIDRQQQFVQMLVEKGAQVEARFDDVGFHGIDLIENKWATAILNFIKEFV